MSPHVILELPTPERDVMVDKKMKLLKERVLKLQFCVSDERASDEEKCLGELLETARILQLNETEYYFLEDDEKGPFSPRNELAALNMIRKVLQQQRSRTSMETLLDEAINDFEERTAPCFRRSCVSCESPPKALPCTRSTEATLFQWCMDQGVQSKLYIADFEGFGRGCAAVNEIKAGDLVLEIPMNIIISEDVVRASYIGKVLSSIDNIGGDTMCLLWSIKEAAEEASKYAAYFSSLPKSFNTGLSFGVEGLEMLEGTLLFEQIIQAKEHVRAAYEQLFPALSEAEPEAFPKEVFTWDRFLWASELWYSNSIKVRFPDGKIQTCLVPLLGLINHSSTPHITHFSKMDAATNTLKLCSLRHCAAGQQCFLSFGSISNADLLCFYGFVLKENPYDTLLIDLEMPDSPFKSSLSQRYEIGDSHMVRARWLSKSSFTKNGLPTKLLAALRIQFMEEEEAKAFKGDPRHEMVSLENEANVQEAISSTLQMLLESLVANSENLSESWDAKLALEFKRSQQEILESLLNLNPLT